MLLNTIRFGEIEVNENEIMAFSAGIPGFEHLHLFTIIKTDEELPFSFLQAVEDGDIAFIVINPFEFYPSYEFDISEELQSELKIRNEQDLIILTILSVQGNIEEATVNLLAPILCNAREMLGKQVILHDTDYTTKHKLVEMKEAGTVLSKGDAPC
jgi:flagellar assembly factor FliW